MKLSARNILKGKIKEIIEGSVNAEVTIELPGNIQIVAVISKKSSSRLGLAVGKDAYAIIKASNVMVGID
jgi:molybdopterin-binding protein